jgi:hypothetical protein
VQQTVNESAAETIAADAIFNLKIVVPPRLIKRGTISFGR